MGLSIASHQTGTIHGKYNRQILHTYIMKDLINCTLQERRINGHHRTKTAKCQSFLRWKPQRPMQKQPWRTLPQKMRRKNRRRRKGQLLHRRQRQQSGRNDE